MKYIKLQYTKTKQHKDKHEKAVSPYFLKKIFPYFFKNIFYH